LDAAELVFASSAHLARATRALAGRDVAVEIVRWGLDLDRFSPGDRVDAREAVGLVHDGPLVVSVRGFDRVYNPELLLEAFVRVRARRPDAQLLFKHHLRATPPSVQAVIERLGLDEAVTIVGRGPVTMPDVYRAADVVVSISSSDSSPRSVWEALACGRPVVLSDLPWARDELKPGREALIVPLKTESIAEAISGLLDDASLASRLGEKGRSRALAELDLAGSAERIDALYRSVVEGTR
jgi:glycosyltransferase involved in cell wall biosynthesis